MEVMGYIAALFIGISLGLIGGGGSILTVPLFVYLFRVPPIVATSYSLFVVGSTSLVGSVGNYSKQWIDLKIASLVGLTAIATVLSIRRYVIPEIPGLITVDGFEVSFSTVTMTLFALLMIVSSVYMIRHGIEVKANPQKEKSIGTLLAYGFAIGLITGFLGAGGGFLLIPALVIMMHVPMKKAIGTSLLIIAINSLAGFIADFGHYEVNWSLLVPVAIIAIGGVFIGRRLGQKIRGENLKKGFGWFVLVLGSYILFHEIASQF
ncbi:MAG: sulfite exporter TauE/SafE family protein [Chitinophagaceae bacterium]|nr:sulfite exporter TauE/SafE family protein [Chitinophagaceae bacterium]